MGIESFDFTRHSIKPKGEDAASVEYKGISEKGVELAQERARDILRNVESMPEGGVMIIGGASEQVRTRSTAEVYGDELKRLIQESGRTDIKVVDSEDMRLLANAGREGSEPAGITSMLQTLAGEIKDHRDVKYVIDAPLFLNEFAMGNGRWLDDQGNYSPYLLRLLELADNDEKKALELWFENQGQVDGLEGPNPKDLAEEQLQGIARLGEFAERFLPERSLSIGTVGHSWNVDALAVYLANNGTVDLEGYRNVGGQISGETEMVRVETDGGAAKLVYGDRFEMAIDHDLIARAIGVE